MEDCHYNKSSINNVWICCMFGHTWHTYIHIHTYMHAYIHLYIYTFVHLYICTCINLYMQTCMHAYIHDGWPLTFEDTHLLGKLAIPMSRYLLIHSTQYPVIIAEQTLQFRRMSTSVIKLEHDWYTQTLGHNITCDIVPLMVLCHWWSSKQFPSTKFPSPPGLD